MSLPEIDTQFLLAFLSDLLNTPSPTGFAHKAIALTQQTLETMHSLAHPDAQRRPGGKVAGRTI